MTPAVRDELAWAIRHAEHEYAERLAHDPNDRANAKFWLGAAQGLRFAIEVALGEPALAEVLRTIVPDFLVDDGMAVSA